MDQPRPRQSPLGEVLTPEEATAYSRWLHLANRCGVDYAVGGALAVYAYTGIWRDTKDLDIFVKPTDLKAVLEEMAAAGFDTEVTDPHWLAKVRRRPYDMDLIFGSTHRKNGVDDLLLSRRRATRLLDTDTHLISPEGLIATKACIAKHYRFDGADIAHVIFSLKGDLDWRHLLEQLRGHHELLLWHLIFFNFVYPGRSGYLPQSLMIVLFHQMQRRWRRPKRRDRFRGMLLDPSAFETDCRFRGVRAPGGGEPLVDRTGEAR